MENFKHTKNKILNSANKNDPETDVENALQIITSRFSNLNEEIISKNKKLKENEILIQSLTDENKILRVEKTELLNENRILKQTNSKLKEENYKLINFKSRIIHSQKCEDLGIIDNLSSQCEKDLNSSKREKGKEFMSPQNSPDIKKIKSSHIEMSERNYTKTIPINDNYQTESTIKHTKENSINEIPTYNVEDLINKIKNNSDISQNNPNKNSVNQNKRTYKIDGRINELKEKLKIKKIVDEKKTNKSYNTNLEERINHSRFNREGDFNNINKIDNKSKQYILSLKFFNNCRVLLDANNYHNLINDIIEKNNIDSHEDKHKRIKQNLKNHPDLLEDFEELYPTLNDDVYEYLKRT